MLDSATENAFLQAILADPDDDAPRLIYADWLDENGDADRAEFIRLQIGLSNTESTNPEFASLQSRAEELRQAHHVEWLNELPQFEKVAWEVFDRGFISAVRFDHPDAFFAHAGRVVASAPVSELRLHQFFPNHAARLADSQYTRGIRVLDLNDGNNVGNNGAEAIAASANLSELKTLKLRGNSIGPAGVRAIAHSSYIRGLKRLRLERNELYDDGLRFIAASQALRELSQLDLERTLTGDEGVAILARSKHLTGLRLLDLGNNRITDKGVQSLSKSNVLEHVRVLFLQGNSITDRGIIVLAESPQFGRLERLFLHGNRIGDDAANALARSSSLGHLHELYLGTNSVSDQAAEALRRRFGTGVNTARNSK
jgi:uncharacterized protein (TIGR02996 family)